MGNNVPRMDEIDRVVLLFALWEPAQLVARLESEDDSKPITIVTVCHSIVVRRLVRL